MEAVGAKEVPRTSAEVDPPDCAWCATLIERGAEVVVLEIVDVEVDGLETVLNTDDGYYFQPYITHYECWTQAVTWTQQEENQADSDEAEQEEVPEDAVQVHECQGCKGPIFSGDRAVAVTIADFVRSKIGDNTVRRSAQPDFLCRACACLLTDELPDWTELQDETEEE